MKKLLLIALTLLLCLLLTACAAEEKDHPCVFIETEGGVPILSREEYVPATVTVSGCPEAYALTAQAGVRVRGNSSAEQGDEKPYRIKFEKKQNMLGLHGGNKYKSWVLLRTHWHLASDCLGFRLGEAVFGGQYYVSDCAFVNLYVNGESRGVYLLCEQNQAAKERVWVEEPKEGDTRTAVGYLVEMDNYPDDDPRFWIPPMGQVTDIAGNTRMIHDRHYSIKSDTWSREQETFIADHVKGCFRILYAAAADGVPMMLNGAGQPVPAGGVYATPFEAVDAVLDLNSLANMIILEELTQNYDVGMGSHFMAVDFSPESRYPKLTFLAPWDFSWGFSEPADGGYYACTFQKLQEMDYLDRSNPWYVLAMKIDGFPQLVRKKWRALADSGVLEATVARVEADCDAMRHDLGPDAWKADNGRKLCDYVRQRIVWLNAQWGAD